MRGRAQKQAFWTQTQSSGLCNVRLVQRGTGLGLRLSLFFQTDKLAPAGARTLLPKIVTAVLPSLTWMQCCIMIEPIVHAAGSNKFEQSSAPDRKPQTLDKAHA